MNRLAAIALTIASLFLIVMAVLVNSPSLFYMATAVVATLAAARIQAWLSVRGLRFDRNVPPAVRLGEMLEVSITVWSERRIQRPLVTLVDMLPSRLVVSERSPCLPIAPSFDQPIQARYRFRPLRRGRFRWNRLAVHGTDALGLVTMEHIYETEPVELTVHPAPIPIAVDVRPRAGWGLTDLDSGRSRGSGLEPRGLREYAQGDPIRFIHWPTTARTGRVMVKEFESGSGATVAYVLQRTSTIDDAPAFSPFEAMCGHALFLAGDHVRRGASVYFPQVEDSTVLLQHPELRERNIRELLTDISPNLQTGIAEELAAVDRHAGMTFVIFVCLQDPELPDLLARMAEVHRVVLVYDALHYNVPGDSASDPRYIDRLESSGAVVHAVPKTQVPK